MLSGFLAKHYDQLSSKHQAAFAFLLEQQDPLILDWIRGVYPAPQEHGLDEIVSMIRHDVGI